ncbi:MAG: PD-(D/E)XK nuclease family protein, partial [Clostridia bacterium]|nr:PD-(D/E)XK nuclease family protein [Clostridia bacterium]
NAFYACEKDGDADYILAVSGKKITEKIGGAELLFKGETSPTALENFFKCPFVAFMQNGLKLKENVKSEMDYAEIGSVMHKVFEEYSKRIGKITDKAYSDMEIERIKGEILEDSENGRHLSSSRGEYLLNAIFDECKDFCYKNYSAYSDSDFKFARAEVAFGEGKEKTGGFPAVSLAGGDIKLKGVIDRIDVFVSPDGTKYCRIVDYKTGKREVKDKDLFTGVKLQLFLYAAAVKGYRIAGVYYMPVLDRFLKKGESSALTVGKTVNEKELLYAQDKKFAESGKGDFISGTNTGRNGGLVSEEELSAYLKYALKVCERGAKEMLRGYVKPSPAAGACEFCPYFSVCGNDGKERSVGSVSAKTIAESVEKRTVGEKEDAES